MAKDYGNLLGCRFFRKQNDKLEVLKVTSFVNMETARVVNIETKAVQKIEFETLESKYTLLRPDGYIAFSIVNIGDHKDRPNEDVIVSLFRTREIESDPGVLPYCVCRQNIVNVYNEIIKKYDNRTTVGMCMSIETVPEGIDYRMMLVCNNIVHYTSVAYYIDDSLKDVLSCIRKMYLYDDVLEELYKYNMTKLPKEVIEIEQVEYQQVYGGYCRTLETLLCNCEFMYDVRRGFGIAEVGIIINSDDDIIKLNNTQLETIEKSYGFKMLEPIVTRYDKSIDLNKIEKDHCMIADMHDNIYLIVYTSEDDAVEYSHEMENTMNPSDKLKMIFNSTNN